MLLIFFWEGEGKGGEGGGEGQEERDEQTEREAEREVREEETGKSRGRGGASLWPFCCTDSLPRVQLLCWPQAQLLG
jgi:hypothetical protein